MKKSIVTIGGPQAAWDAMSRAQRKATLRQLKYLKRIGKCIIILAIFPTKQEDLNTYFNDILGYLTSATQTRLGIVGTKFTAFSNLLGGPISPTATPPGTNGTPGTWNYVYPQATAEGTTNKLLVAQKDAQEKQMKDAITNMYTDIPDSAITLADTNALGIRPKSDRKKANRNPEKITQTVVISLEPLGGGQMKVRCRTSSDSKRASKLNLKCEIEFAYSVVDKGETPPANSDACSVKTTVTRASSILALGEDAIGKKLYLFARWTYTKHPKSSGAFSTAVSMGIA